MTKRMLNRREMIEVGTAIGLATGLSMATVIALLTVGGVGGSYLLTILGCFFVFQTITDTVMNWYRKVKVKESSK